MRRTLVITLFVFISVCGPAYAQRLPPAEPPLEKINYQPGDVLLLRSPNKIQRFITGLATRGEITHAGFVIMGDDGKLKLVEVLGNNDGISFKYNPGPKFGVIINDLIPILEQERDKYKQQLFILPRKDPLSPEQSAALTAFAYAKEGKSYASLGVFGPPTLSPFKNRPVKTDAESYMCSAFVCAALVAADILPPDFNPPAVAPFDFYDPSRFTISVEVPKLGPNGGVMYMEPLMVPARNSKGKIITEKKKNWFTGEVTEIPIMVQATYNAIKAGWKPAGPLTLLSPEKIIPTPDTFLNP